jgi:RND family efflux transporter MFP subunit
VTLRPEAEGKVIEVALTAGQRYAAGDVLLRLDDSDQRLALALTETRLAEAERVRERYQRLRGSGTATTATLDEAVTAAEIARIELERTRDALAKRLLRAPFAGVAGLPSIEVGDWIDTGDEVAAYDDRSVLLVEFELPEAFLGRIVTGLPVTARTPAFRERVFEGSVSAIDSRVNATSRAARVRIAIPNDEDLLRPGASFAIALKLEGGQFPLVPELAVQFSRGTLHVWRVADGKAEQVVVTLVRRRAGEVLVDGPLAEGDLVVIEGTQRLGPGKPVTVIETQGGGAT